MHFARRSPASMRCLTEAKISENDGGTSESTLAWTPILAAGPTGTHPCTPILAPTTPVLSEMRTLPTLATQAIPMERAIGIPSDGSMTDYSAQLSVLARRGEVEALPLPETTTCQHADAS